MDFVGSGKTLVGRDFQDAASELNLGVAEIRAVIEVEAAGSGFFTDKRPKILFEPHVFYHQLGPGMSRDLAVARGVAYPRWGEKPYPKSADARYKQLAVAMNIDVTKALRSASWGLPQIIGYNFSACGYGGVIEMVEDFKKGEREQLMAMTKLLTSWHVVEYLQHHRWDKFAFAYNGPRFADNAYHKKLEHAYLHFSDQASAAMIAAPPVNFAELETDDLDDRRSSDGQEGDRQAA